MTGETKMDYEVVAAFHDLADETPDYEPTNRTEGTLVFQCDAFLALDLKDGDEDATEANGVSLRKLKACAKNAGVKLVAFRQHWAGTCVDVYNEDGILTDEDEDYVPDGDL